jgi:hypothetical protein
MNNVQSLVFKVNDKEYGTGNIKIIIDDNIIPAFVDNNDLDQLRTNLKLVLNNLGDKAYTDIK